MAFLRFSGLSRDRPAYTKLKSCNHTCSVVVKRKKGALGAYVGYHVLPLPNFEHPQRQLQLYALVAGADQGTARDQVACYRALPLHCDVHLQARAR